MDNRVGIEFELFKLFPKDKDYTGFYWLTTDDELSVLELSLIHI